MNKQFKKVKAFLEGKKTALETQKKNASLTDDQKTKIDIALQEVQDAITALDSATEETTNEQLIEIFTKAMESLTASSDAAVEAMKSEVEASINKIQAKLEKANASKKFKASLSLKTLKASQANAIDGHKPFSAGVDVTAWTPEAEVEDIEVYHQLIGVAAGFEVSTTAKTAIKLRKLEKGSGAAAVVLNHGIKPKIEYVGEQSVVNVDTYAGVVEGIADEDLEDNPTLENELQMEALSELGVAENVAALALLDSVAKPYGNINFGTVAYADEKTAIAAMIDQVRQALGTRTSDINMAANSSQWAKLKDLRNANGTPIDITSVIGDVKPIVDNSIAGDTIYVFAKRFAKIRMYMAAKAEWYKGVKAVTTEGVVTAVYSEWRLDESSLRARQRQAIYVTDDTTVVKASLAGVVAAVKAVAVEG